MLEPHIAPPACVTEDAFAALMEISRRPPVVFVEGRGSWLTDQEGKKYLDFILGLGSQLSGPLSYNNRQRDQVAGRATLRQAVDAYARLVRRGEGSKQCLIT